MRKICRYTESIRWIQMGPLKEIKFVSVKPIHTQPQSHFQIYIRLRCLFRQNIYWSTHTIEEAQRVHKKIQASIEHTTKQRFS